MKHLIVIICIIIVILLCMSEPILTNDANTNLKRIGFYFLCLIGALVIIWFSNRIKPNANGA